MAKNKVSIYLLKSSIDGFNDAFKKKPKVMKKYNEDKIAYYINSKEHPPKWIKDFFNLDVKKDKLKLRLSSAKAVLFVRRLYNNQQRIFAITFGFAKSLLKDNVFEERFGLRVALNSCGNNDDTLKKITATNIGRNHKQTIEQLPSEGKISEFSFDADSDLIKQVAALSMGEAFDGAMLVGGNALCITQSVNVGTIEAFLDKCYDYYLRDTYRDKFGWIDKIKPVGDKKIISDLDKIIMKKIEKNQLDNIILAVPQIVDWENIISFKYSPRAKKEYGCINIKTFLEYYKKRSTCKKGMWSANTIKSKKIIATSKNDKDKDKSWPVYHCLVTDTRYKGQEYYLNNGHWYCIDSEFADNVNSYYTGLDICGLEFCPYKDGNDYDENVYNEELSEKIGGHLIHRIGEISHGGGSGNRIEVCDVLKDRKFIHIKKGNASNLLSHLFAQGSVSGEALLDETFRKKFYEKAKAEEWNDIIDTDYKPVNYNIVYGIICSNVDENGRPNIPFFSKVTLRYHAKHLMQLGYKVEIKGIQIV